MSAVEAGLPQGRFASARPALFVFFGCFVACISWGVWYHVAGGNPPLGIAIGFSVGALILTDTKLWPLLTLATFLAYSIMEPNFPLAGKAAGALGLGLGAWLTATIIKRLDIHPAEVLRPDTLARVFVAAIAGSALAAGLNSLVALTYGGTTTFIDKFAQQGLGMLLAAPLVLVWGTPPRQRWSLSRWAGFAVTMLACAATAILVFLTPRALPIAWAIFPPMVVAALGWHLRGATTAAAICAVAVLWGVHIHAGPFMLVPLAHPTLFAQAFVAVACSTIIVLAAHADERHAEDKLRIAARRVEASRRNLANMARDAAAAVAILDRDMRYVAVSLRYLRDNRLPEDMRLEGRSHFEIFPDCPPDKIALYARVLEGEQLSGHGDLVRHPDGSADYVRWNYRPWHDEDDRIAGIILSSEIVTAELEARRRLEEAERRYRAVFEQAGVGVGRLSQGGLFLEVNDRICELTGYAREELIGKSYRIVGTEEEWPSTEKGFQALARGELGLYADDRMMVTREGALRPVHCTANLVRSGDGGEDYFAIVVQDISPRVAAQQALEEKEKLLRLAQEAAGVGVWEIDLEEGGAHLSPETARMFGLPWRAGKYRMADFDALLGDTQVQALRKAIGTARRELGPLGMTMELGLADGARRWITLQGRYDPHDGHPRLLGLAIDNTRDVEAEARLHDVHEKLLRLARLDAMGAMASTLAHELNQPLAAITNYLEACRYLTRSRGDPDHAILDALDRARVQALRAGDIIRKIRSFTVSGEIVKAQLDLGAVIQAACTAVRQLKVANGARIEVELGAESQPLIGDALQIEQVVGNLIRNGLEATAGEDDRRVRVSTHIEGEEVRVEVADNGAGLSDELLANLFEPFRTTKESGTGLGLPICRTIVEAHGGRLWAENGADGGAVFNFTLPVATDPNVL